MKKRVNIRRSFKLCHEIFTLIPLSKSVWNRNIGVVKQLFYVLDENNIDMISLSGAINKINANKRIRITSNLCITQILRHDQSMIDSRKFSQQDVIWTWNEIREARKKQTYFITQDSAKPGPNRIVMAVTIHIKNNTQIIIIIPSDVSVSCNNKKRTMLSIEFLMLQFRPCKNQISPPKHIRFWWRHDHQTPT